MKKIFNSASPEMTEKIGYDLALALLRRGDRRAFVALRGEMGVGKTAFCRGFASALGISGVKSPTYTVVNEYKSDIMDVFHFDTYRIEGADDLYSIGYYDYLERDGYILCEWSENIEDDIPEYALTVTVARVPEDENARTVCVESKGDIYADACN